MGHKVLLLIPSGDDLGSMPQRNNTNERAHEHGYNRHRDVVGRLYCRAGLMCMYECVSEHVCVHE